ncbi:MAG: DUF1893 domain-containing protein, partial [Clostridia bacterium]|nr:DUF1893 domain-containing protein [Clostridia bacterium]
ICLCKNGECLYSEKRGIAPLMGFLAQGVDLRGYSVADKVVGKAAAFLFVKCGIREAFAETLSQSAKAVLEAHGIPVTYSVLTEKIINRAGTDMCPMEKTVLNVDNAEDAYLVLKEKMREMGIA